jgi:hypothetical protein
MRSMTSLSLVGAALLAGSASFSLAAEATGSAAILGVTLIDTSTEGDYNPPREDETARIALLRGQLADSLAERGWTLIDPAPVADQLDRVVNPADCNGCDARLGAELGADLAVTAEVQKVSNLILTINVLVRDTGSGDLVAVGNADIRGNTDQSWTRGLSWVMRNRIFPLLEAGAAAK